MPRRNWFLMLWIGALLAAPACLKDDTLDVNLAPQASAGKDQQLDFDGEPIEVRLDGSGSSDPDGKVASYTWRSAVALPDGGVDNGPEGALDPKDVQKPTITLDRGNYAFTLWVTDDDGAVSAPDSVLIRVGTDPVEECTANVFEMVPDSCARCVCDIDDACRKAAVACGPSCWGLLSCIGAMCPDATDTACIIEKCSAFLDAVSPTQAMAVGTPCVVPCADSCSSGAMGGGSDGGTDAGADAGS